MKKKILLIFLFLLLFQVVYAVENTYPTIDIGGKTYGIDENSTFVDFVAYFFMMIISIGAVLLLMVLIWAGVNFIMAGGDPGKISKAKELVMNGFTGLVILLSSFWIINTINEGIIEEIKDPDIGVCSSMGGILITISDGTNTTKKCINQSTEKLEIEGSIIATEWMFKPEDIKEVWAFAEEGFRGTGTPLYFNDDAMSPGSIIGTLDVPSSTKSIYILPRLQGFYFYDTENYGTTKERSFFIYESIPNINETKRLGFDNKASSFTSVYIPIHLSESSTVYNQPHAVIFEDANYSGKCSIINSQRSASLESATEFPDSSYTDIKYIGNNKMTSIIVYNTKGIESGPDKGKIILYNTLDCAIGTSEQHSICEIDINTYKSQIIDMKEKSASFTDFPCPDWDEDSYIQSIEMPDGKGAVVVIGDNDNCAYFNAQDDNCIGDLRGPEIFQGGSFSGVRPVKVIVLPTN